MSLTSIFALGVFIIVLGLIISEKLHRTVAAMAGVVVVLLVRILTPSQALQYVDFNTLLVLMGMMIVVSIVKKTGVFEYLAIVAAKKAKGDPWRIIVFLCAVTALISAFLDNVTTVLLIVPMTFVITKKLNVNPMPFLIPEILASNIGGTATLIGDPPNIMIGSRAGLSFTDFIVNLGPIIVLVFAAVFFVLWLLYHKQLHTDAETRQKVFELDETVCIKDKGLLYKCGAVLLLIVLGFILHDVIGMENGVIAMTGAVLLLLLSRSDVEDALLSIEWPTIFFFTSLFVLVGALEEAGLIASLAGLITGLVKDNLLLAGVLLIWFSALVSSFLDNIPFVATLIPLILGLGAQGVDIAPLWWAVSLGACLGGNGTLIGASANVVVAGLAAKQGYVITFRQYLKVGFPLMMLSVALSMVYLILFYLT
ncbi:MAG TPA: ArsB/NhaD family transporter [Candidatus Limiplasma sp.]|nr:ArsB/NhaD family transporter [Candidatus Limiplasma sp.]